jgi:hypothetical protein
LAKKFHFQELDYIITFPDSGNDGKKYQDYSVVVSSLKEKSADGCVCLVDIVESPEFQSFPHTVGFFKSETAKPSNIGSDYLEIRIVRCVEEFWKFLNDLNL